MTMLNVNFLKTLLLYLASLGLLVADSNEVAAETKWTHSWEVGEDATSSFYNFIEVRGTVVRVRMLWNGGGQQAPTITDYFLTGGEIRIVKKKGTREDRSDLILGRDTKLIVVSDYKLACAHTRKMLAPPLPDQSLTDGQRIDLYNLILLLAEDRDRYRITLDVEKGGE